MPHFSEDGFDIVICQLCARLVNSGHEQVEWRTDLTGNEHAGNVCERCLRKASPIQPVPPTPPTPRPPGERPRPRPRPRPQREDDDRSEICMGCGTRCGTNGRCQE